LNLLVMLEALVAERSVSNAARRLGLTLSAVSHALRRLRTTFNDELFIRSPNGMEPTLRAIESARPQALRNNQSITESILVLFIEVGHVSSLGRSSFIVHGRVPHGCPQEVEALESRKRPHRYRHDTDHPETKVVEKSRRENRDQRGGQDDRQHPEEHKADRKSAQAHAAHKYKIIITINTCHDRSTSHPAASYASRANFRLCVVGLLMPDGLRGDMTAPASGCVHRLRYADAFGVVRADTKRDREKKVLAREAIASGCCCHQRRRVVIVRCRILASLELRTGIPHLAGMMSKAERPLVPIRGLRSVTRGVTRCNRERRCLEMKPANPKSLRDLPVR
jgi:hypothetical protein